MRIGTWMPQCLGMLCLGMLTLASTAHGSEVAGLLDSEDFVARGNNCSRSSGAYAEVDLLFMRYHRADGVRVGTNADDTGGGFGFELSPKVTLGYQGCNGLGTRISYWRYDHSADIGTTAGQYIDVDTFIIDAEFYRQVQFGNCWGLEVSGGVRYQDFREDLNDPDRGTPLFSSNFDGLGVTVGFELDHSVTCCTSLYARGKFAVLMGDSTITNGAVQPYTDTIVQQTELGVGVEHNRTIGCRNVYFRGGLELWQFDDMSGVFDSDSDFDDSSAVGFGGFVFRTGFQY